MKVQTKLLISLTVIAAAIIGLYAWRVLPAYFQSSRGATSGNPEVAPREPRVLPTDQVRGKNNASKTIIEFGDIECPYCGQIDPQLNDLVKTRSNVRLAWKDCPLPSHPNAKKAAEAALCAGDQGKYWEYHDLLVASNDQLGPKLYSSIALALKLNTIRFANCLDTGAKRAQVLNSLSECAAAGVEELPWFSVNGKIFSGANAMADLTNELNSK